MSRDILLKILDLARWAPSGDNTQPWRFEIIDDHHVAIHAYDTRDHVLYDFDGHPSHMSHGALLETLRLAATRFGLEAEWTIRPDRPDTAPIYDVTLRAADIAEDPLVPFIETRCVQRRPMRTTPLTAVQKQALIDSVGNSYSLRFFETLQERWAVARLLWNNARIRLTCPEAYTVHRDIIHWGVRHSDDRIPEEALGVDRVTAKIMKWAMKSWERVDFMNRYMLGTVAPRIQLDLLPAMGCAAHVLLITKNQPTDMIDYVRAGVALQRLWLTAALHGLHLQPEMTPLIFHWYVKAARQLSSTAAINARSTRLSNDFNRIVGRQTADTSVFMCRVGLSENPVSRSTRKTLRALLENEKPT